MIVDGSRLEQWLTSPRRTRYPRTIGELLPGNTTDCLIVDNDPSVDLLDASGFLTVDRLMITVDVCIGRSYEQLILAYWDGWSGIAQRIEALRIPVVVLELPDRRYLAIEGTAGDLEALSRDNWPYLGPSIVVAGDRSSILFSDVDWPVTYLGFPSPLVAEASAKELASRGIAPQPICTPDTPVFG
ncbi:hypothetical protein BMS3Bbin01_02625 [bacterium BMS3Bbin01]|nr:hypothetical protein BMS3Bbin01_02625 [bacterium BMS3Bbin01]